MRFEIAVVSCCATMILLNATCTLAVWSSEHEASRVPDGSHFTALTPFCGGGEEGEREVGRRREEMGGEVRRREGE